MTEPSTREEYLERFHANTRIQGEFIDLANHVPCPFCAAPDWAVWLPAAGIFPDDDRPTLDDQMRADRFCVECGRSGKHIVLRDVNGVTVEFVQTGGPPPPAWLTPPPRRV